MTGMRCTRNLVTNESPSLGSHQASPRKLCTDRANLSLGLGGKKPKLLITEIKTPDSSKSYQVKWLKLKPKLNLKFEKLYAESVNCKLTSFQGPGQKKTGRCAAGKPSWNSWYFRPFPQPGTFMYWSQSPRRCHHQQGNFQTSTSWPVTNNIYLACAKVNWGRNAVSRNAV